MAVSFKKLQNQNPCIPGDNQVSYKEKIPPGEAPPGTPPPTPGTDICTCLGDKLDTIAGEIQQTYDSGPSFNAHDLNGNTKLLTETATPVQIDAAITSQSPDLNVIGWYNNIEVATTRGGVNLPLCWVIADPDGAVDPNNPFLYVRYSNEGTSTFSQEITVRVGEDWAFRNVYSLRIRSSIAGQQFRVTSDAHRTTYVSTVVNIPPGPGPGITTPPFANRTDFTDINISVGLVDQTLPPIPVPNGFSLSLRSSVENAFGSKIYTSRVNATIPGLRNTLLPGDVKEYYITNTDLIHIAGDRNGLTLDISVEL